MCGKGRARSGARPAARVAQVLARFNPTPMEMVAVNDSFGESGTPTQLLTKYGLGPENIVQAVEKVLKRKK